MKPIFVMPPASPWEASKRVQHHRAYANHGDTISGGHWAHGTQGSCAA